MKVLLLAYHYPPDPAVGALRAGKIAQAFRRRGHTVEVVSARLPSEHNNIREVSGIPVSTVRVLAGPREWWAWLKSWRRKAPSHAAAHVAGPDSSGGTSRVRRLLLSLIWTPDDRQGFIPPALLTALPKAWKADLIYSTAPPFSDHLAALFLHWCTRKRLVVEFRDPWTANTWKTPEVRSGMSEALERWMERRCLQAAFRVVAVSDGIGRALLDAAEPAQQHKLLVVRNGIDRLSPPRPPRTPGAPIRIVHVGTFYFNRDPLPFLRALAELKGDHAPPFVVELVGQCRWFGSQSVEDAVRELGLSDVVRFRDWVPHEESQAIIESADLLLLLAQGQPAQVPNKLYEYLGTRIPILGFADDEGESAAMLRAIEGHVVISTTSASEIKQAVRGALQRAEEGLPPGTAATLREWTTESQMDRLLAALEPGSLEGTTPDMHAPWNRD